MPKYPILDSNSEWSNFIKYFEQQDLLELANDNFPNIVKILRKLDSFEIDHETLQTDSEEVQLVIESLKTKVSLYQKLKAGQNWFVQRSRLNRKEKSLASILTGLFLKLATELKSSGYIETASAELDQNDEENNVHQQTDELLCDYCQSSNEKNRYGQHEELLICKDCSNKAHPSCLNYSPELVEQIRSDGSWQCIDCKACFICNGTGDPDTLLFCDACDKGYHMQCHTPKLEQTPSGKWACATCMAKGKSVANTATKQVLVIDDDTTEKPQVKISSTTPVTSLTPDTFITITTMSPVSTMEVMPLVSAPRRVFDGNSAAAHQPQKPPPPAPSSIMPVKHSTNVVYHPSGLTYTHIPAGSTAMTLPPGHPVSMQHQFIPVNYMLPNGATAAQQIPQALPVQRMPAVPTPPQAMPNPVQQTVMGKGVHNDLTHILNPKLPLPDVRSAIREDVLRSLPQDVADWTVQNVVFYFKSHGYIHESKLLEEQEIDGRAMLLMSRNDCLTGLRIKLGPALKIYHMHIHKLQKRTDFLG